MKLLRTATLLLTLLFVISTASLASAESLAEYWITDPSNSSKICIMLWGDNMKLVSAAWSGPSVDGKAEGKGLLNFVYTDNGKEKKVQADAEMKAGKLDGKASVNWANDYTYDGYYKEGLRSGKGVYKSTEGVIQDGDWLNGLMNGKGSLHLPDGRVFEGDFVDGLPTGKVFYKMPDGRTYKGDMVKAVFQGSGVMTFPDGSVHDGDWVNGVPNGKGTLRLASGIIYEGDFVNGKRTGKGIQKFPDGSRYEGDFLDNMFDGVGTLYSPDGAIAKQGNWKKNEFLTNSPPSQTIEKQGNGPMPGNTTANAVLGIPWWSAEDDAHKIMLTHSGTVFMGASSPKNCRQRSYVGFYNNELSRIQLLFYQNKMFAAGIELFAGPDQIMNKFNAVKKEMTGLYGPPEKEGGTHLDSYSLWSMGDGFRVGITINDETAFTASAGIAEWLRKPFGLAFVYTHSDTWNTVFH